MNAKIPIECSKEELVNRRNLFLIIAWLFFIAFAFNSCTTSEEPGRYYSKDFGFSIIFPVGWEIQTIENGWITLAVTELEGPTDPWAEAVVVDVFEQPQGFDLDNTFNDRVHSMNMNAVDFREEDRGEVTINGERARWIIYSYSEHEIGDLMVIEYLLVKGKRAFIISGDSPPDTFSEFEEIFITAARSFRLE
jgi:hypothetical protein